MSGAEPDSSGAVDRSGSSGANGSIAIIGAGIAGAACGSALRRAGANVRLFEKSRGWGGRAATRRLGDLRFDHGAQYFTARRPSFRAQVASWIKSGTAARWRGRIVEITPRGQMAKGNRPARYVGVPGMSALAAELGSGLALRRQFRIEGLARLPDGRWRLYGEAGPEPDAFDAVVVAIPSAQAAAMLDSAAPALAHRCREARQVPCWAVMASFQDRIACGFDGAFIARSSLAWGARDSSKPGRAEQPDAWVLHATPEWSAEHLEAEAAVVASILLSEFLTLTKRVEQRPTELAAHLWRYARSEKPLAEEVLIDSELGLAVCGDWLAGDRIEGAFRSGRAAADALLRISRGRRGSR